MTLSKKQSAPWLAVTALALALTACGGGGDGGSGTGGSVQPGPVADARNGTYATVAANGREYSLALDFDALTYRVTSATGELSGNIAQQGDEFVFLPGNAVGTAGFNTARFQLATDAVVGEFNFAEGTAPFVAARKFVSTIAAAAGTYNMLGRRVDAAGAGIDTSIQQGQITADGNLRTCDNDAILRIADCPAGSVTTSPVTVSGDVFTASVPAQGTFTFRVAQVGSDKVFLRASPSTTSTRRFVLGTPATGTFTGGTFEGGTTEPAWGSVTLGATTFSSVGTSPSGVTVTRTGTSNASGPVVDIRVANTTNAGNFFAARSSEIGIVVAARGNTLATGFVAIGRAQ